MPIIGTHLSSDRRQTFPAGAGELAVWIQLYTWPLVTFGFTGEEVRACTLKRTRTKIPLTCQDGAVHVLVSGEAQYQTLTLEIVERDARTFDLIQAMTLADVPFLIWPWFNDPARGDLSLSVISLNDAPRPFWAGLPKAGEVHRLEFAVVDVPGGWEVLY